MQNGCFGGSDTNAKKYQFLVEFPIHKKYKTMSGKNMTYEGVVEMESLKRG